MSEKLVYGVCDTPQSLPARSLSLSLVDGSSALHSHSSLSIVFTTLFVTYATGVGYCYLTTIHRSATICQQLWRQRSIRSPSKMWWVYSVLLTVLVLLVGFILYVFRKGYNKVKPAPLKGVRKCRLSVDESVQMLWWRNSLVYQTNAFLNLWCFYHRYIMSSSHALSFGPSWQDASSTQAWVEARCLRINEICLSSGEAHVKAQWSSISCLPSIYHEVVSQWTISYHETAGYDEALFSVHQRCGWGWTTDQRDAL